MFDAIRRLILRAMRVPAEPTPPAGAPNSVRVFRAGHKLYQLRLLRWAVSQIGATIGLCFSIGFFWWFKSEVEKGWLANEQAAVHAASPGTAATGQTPPAAPPAATDAPKPAKETVSEKRAKPNAQFRRGYVNFFKSVATRTPRWGMVVLEIFEVGGILAFLAQIPVTYTAVRLEFELRWYIVTDRSLRIRSGLVSMQESTMSFANLQQVSVSQGPLQRLLGIADVQVESAGGGGGGEPGHKHDDSLHTGIFHGVDNANEIRDLILERLRQFRQAGLGDPDDHHQLASSATTAHAAMIQTSSAVALAAAQELLAETRALRAVLS